MLASKIYHYLVNPQIDILLRQLIEGTISLTECSEKIQHASRAFIDADGIAKLDLDRRARTGIPEAIYCPGKSIDQIICIASRFIEHGFTNVIGSRAVKEVADAIVQRLPQTKYFSLSQTLLFNPDESKNLVGNIGIVTAGTSDLAIAEETQIVCNVLGSKTTLIADVGIASIQRTLVHVEEFRAMNVLIVLAGMEGALPSVIAGLINVPIIALPTSIGYGVNAGGFNALLSNLGSCVPGVMTVNIDNGFGAACAAHKINFAIETK